MEPIGIGGRDVDLPLHPMSNAVGFWDYESLPEWEHWVMDIAMDSDGSWRVRLSFEPDVAFYGDGRDDLWYAEGD